MSIFNDLYHSRDNGESLFLLHTTYSTLKALIRKECSNIKQICIESASHVATKRAIARIPAQISRAVGTICVAGNRNPYVPRSRSSTVYAYFIPATPFAQSSDAPRIEYFLLKREKSHCNRRR
jgi:hypothetical protein